MDEINKDDPYYWSLWLLAKGHIFPNKISEKSLKLWMIKAISIRFATFMFIIVGASCHMYQLIKAGIEANLSEDISVIVGGGGIICTLVLFITSSRRWSEFLRKVLDIRPFGRPSNLETVSERLRLTAKIAYGYAFFGSILYAYVNYLDSTTCEELRAKGFNSICGLMLPLWLPFEVNAAEKWTLFTIQFLLSQNVTCCGLQVSIFVNEVSQVLICHIGHLREVIEQDFHKDDTYETLEERLRYFVRYHNYILGMCQEMKYLVRRSVGHLPLIAAVVFGAIANQVFNAKPVCGMVFLCGWVVALFAVCYTGQKIMDEVATLNEAIISSSWYNLPPKLQKNLHFIIMRTQKDFMYEAIPLGTMNYSVFMAIIQTSYSYLTLLNKST